MRVGKFNPELLSRLLAKAKVDDPRVLLGPKVGEDAALIDYGDRVLVAKTDPVTFASHLIGWYVVQVNANDVACAGATPLWFLATLLIPETMTETEAEGIFKQVLEACSSLGVTLVGGHSEVTRGITQPIVVGCMLGEVQKGNIVRTGGAQVGDSVVLTKGIALEGTALLAYEAPAALEKAGVTEETVAKAKELLFYPGISIVPEARVSCTAVSVTSLHDPTEGGLATGLWEVATAAGVGIGVDEGAVPVLPESRDICKALGLDPLGLLASGALLITLPRADVPHLLSALEANGIAASEIGRVTKANEGVRLIRAGEQVPLPRFERDELARYLSP